MNDENYVPQHAAEEPIIGDPPPRLNTVFSNDVYDKLKWVSLVLLPALGALYFGMSQLIGLPYGVEVVGTIALLDTFLGSILGYSSKQYQNETRGELVGFLDVELTDEGKKVQLEFPGDPNDIDQHDKVTFKVRRH